MEVRVSGKQFEVGQALIQYSSDKIKKSAHKYLSQAISATIHYAKNAHLIKCDIHFNEGSGRHVMIKSAAECNDAYSSFDKALAKLEKQLLKLKDKITNHHNPKISVIYEESV